MPSPPRCGRCSSPASTSSSRTSARRSSGGAAEGEIFHRGAVQALSPNGQVTPRLAALVRKGLIRPDKAQVAAEEAFRFHHLLLRDAAYDALPKRLRAELHERFAAWLERRGTQLVELDELLGYHLEQVASYLDALAQDSRGLSLAAGERRSASPAGVRSGVATGRTAAGLLVGPITLAHASVPARRPPRGRAHAGASTRSTRRRSRGCRRCRQRAAAADDKAGAALARTVAALARISANARPTN